MMASHISNTFYYMQLVGFPHSFIPSFIHCHSTHISELCDRFLFFAAAGGFWSNFYATARDATSFCRVGSFEKPKGKQADFPPLPATVPLPWASLDEERAPPLSATSSPW